MVRALGVIPARFASTRFPGKPLASLGDRTLIEQVVERARASRRLQRVIVATDDERIANVCRSANAEVLLTSPDSRGNYGPSWKKPLKSTANAKPKTAMDSISCEELLLIVDWMNDKQKPP